MPIYGTGILCLFEFLSMLSMELLHEGCKCLDTLERHGIVDGSAHASNRPVPLELDLRFE